MEMKVKQQEDACDWYFTFEVGGGGEWSFESYSIVSVGHRMFFD